LLEVIQKIAERVRIAQGLDERPERPFVERAAIALQTQRDDAVPLGLFAAGALPQHLGVVDLADLEVGSPASGPRPADAALGDEILRRAREQQEQRAPILGI
jgi:hypothetical protein